MSRLIPSARGCCVSIHTPAPPQASIASNNISAYWFCLSWTVRGGGALWRRPHWFTTVGHRGLEKLRHLILVVKESVDTRSGAGIPNLHTFVRRAARSRDNNVLTLFISSHRQVFQVLPWDKVGVIWGEGHIKNPGSMSTQRASQVSMLPVNDNL